MRPKQQIICTPPPQFTNVLEIVKVEICWGPQPKKIVDPTKNDNFNNGNVKKFSNS